MLIEALEARDEANLGAWATHAGGGDCPSRLVSRGGRARATGSAKLSRGRDERVQNLGTRL